MTSLSLRVIEPAVAGTFDARQRHIALLSTLLTFGRLPLAAGVVVAALAQATWVALGLITLFVVWDVLDGVIARHFGAETQFRRAFDGIVDKVSIHAVAVVVVLPDPILTTVWLCLVARDAAQAVMGLRLWQRTRVVAAGAKWHRSFTLAVTAWGAGALLGLVTIQPSLDVVVVLLAFLTLADYSRQSKALLRTLEVGTHVTPKSQVT